MEGDRGSGKGDDFFELLARAKLYSSGSCKYFPLHVWEINLEKLVDPVYRKKVIGVAPPLRKNEKMKDYMRTIMGTERPRLVAAQSPFMFPWGEPLGYEDGTISIDKMLDFFEDCSHDAFLTEIRVYMGAEWNEGRIKPLPDSYLFRVIGDVGKDEELGPFGFVEKLDLGMLEVKNESGY